MKTCITCESRAPNVMGFTLGCVEIGNCAECGLLIRASRVEHTVGALSGLSSESDSDNTTVASAQNDLSTKPCIYMVVSTEQAATTVREELSDVTGARFKVCVDPAEAMSQFVQDTRLGHSRKLVVFHSAHKDAEGTSFVYAVRAVEMGVGVTQVPILVLGDSSTPMLDRCIQESKNARFVSIGNPPTEVQLVKRYLKVIDKIAKR